MMMMSNEEEMEETDEPAPLLVDKRHIDDLAEHMGLSKHSCSYDKFLKSLIKLLYCVCGMKEMWSERVNLDCLKILEGQPTEILDLIRDVYDKNQETVKARNTAVKEREKAQREHKDQMTMIARETYQQTYLAAILMGMMDGGEFTGSHHLRRFKCFDSNAEEFY